ncbi:hypothetical protein FQA39_LY06494 [Lamprigera yunnana]|nr:hypothetical protein FQA39_LY06494 [Lamprigera yunnana]
MLGNGVVSALRAPAKQRATDVPQSGIERYNRKGCDIAPGAFVSVEEERLSEHTSDKVNDIMLLVSHDEVTPTSESDVIKLTPLVDDVLQT